MRQAVSGYQSARSLGEEGEEEMKEMIQIVALIIFVVGMVAGGWYLSYSACRDKFPNSSWWACVVKP